MSQQEDPDFIDEEALDDSDSRRSFLRLSRDKVLLVSAIVLFALAIGLTLLFSSNPERPTSTAATPSPGGQARATGSPGTRATAGSYPAAGYPGPSQAAVGNAPTATLGQEAPALSATPGQTLPPGLDVTPGQRATPGAAYPAEPGPQGLGTPPTQPSQAVPTFDPERPPTPGGVAAVPSTAQPTIDPSSFDNPQQTATAAGATAFPSTASFPTTASQPSPTAEVAPSEPPIPTELPTSLPALPTPPPLPVPTRPPRPTATLIPPTPIPAPTEVPVDVLAGSVRWTIDRSPITLTRDQQLTAGSVLVIDPGVEVRMAPGVRFFVEGSLVAAGAPGNPVRFVSTGGRWEAIYGRPGGKILIDNAQIRNGGSAGRAVVSQGGELVIKSTLITDNGGGIQSNDSRLELQRNEISGNDVPYGAPVDATYSRGGFAILADNRIGGNRVAEGAASVRIEGASPIDTINMDVQRNLIMGGTPDSPGLEVFSSGQLQGPLVCNTFQQGSVGLALHSDRKQVPGFALQVRNNALLDNTPPIEPVYLDYGIGRGATSDIAVDMSQNWWGESSGPYHPTLNPEGRGDSVGENIAFQPWLTSRPDCTPKP